MRNPIIPAKITAPVLGDVVHRERLYKIIDESSQIPIIFISAPAGYGKTTLVNAYIEKRNIPCLWYKIDAGDGDISSFFYHFGMASKKSTGNKKDMPLLKPEYQLGIPAFTRHYYRELFARLSPCTMVVFDNYQDVGKDSTLHDIMQEAIQEAPQGYCLVFISREEPPCGFAKASANGDMLKISSELLAFTYDESVQAAKLLGIDKKLDIDLLKKIHSCTKGWVTGFKLLLNKKDELKDIGVDLETASQDIVVDYFLGEILSHIDPETKMFLLKISVLPSITVSLAKQLTGLANTKKILNGLIQKQFFTTRHGRFKATYEFHPLFHKFLAHQREEQLAQPELDDIYNTSGLLLADAGDYENAIELLVKTENWDVVIKILEKHAKSLIEQGRNSQLIRWIDRLPPAKLADCLWINYWYGAALTNYDNNTARDRFTKAYQLAKDNNDIQGLYLSWCGIADTFTFAHNNFLESISWIDELHWLRDNFPKYPSIEARARLILSAAMLLIWADPKSPELIYWMKKIELVYKIIPNKALRILCGIQLILDYGQRGEVAKLRHISDALRKYINSEETPDFLVLFLETILVACDYLTAEFKLTNEDIDAAYSRYEEVGLDFFNGFVLSHSIYHAELKDDTERVRQLLDAYRPNISEDSDLDLGHYHHHEAIYSMNINDTNRAIQHARLAIELTEKAHAPFPESVTRTMGAYIYTELGCYDQAIVELEISENILAAYNSHSGLALILLVRSWIALKNTEHDSMILHLTEALDIFYEKDIRSLYLWPHKLINNLCAVALENNIRPEFVKQIITTHKYKPPNNQSVSEHWPYPIKIYTLNRFGLVKNNKNIRLSDKNQQFMKALIAYGGRDVHEETLSDALWPDTEGDAAHQNFATTLHRVRKALGSNVIQLRQNRVSLNPDYCWIDIWAFKRNLGEIERSLLNSEHSLQELTERAVSLYQGPFLGVDENEHWILSAREKLSGQFLKMLNITAESFCQAKEYQLALSSYQKGQEIDDLSEKNYQGLIYCHTCLGNRTEGLAIYEQCRERLNTAFGIEPSSATEKLYKLLKDS
ncbi:MAG: hypothetical protein OEY66_10975 [Gammaproteobacteria bacterium]|nr:hypothetical protein [Gammaproteobacteria bacterium]